VRLKGELKQKEDEANKLKVFVFNEEVKDLIQEILQISHEIRRNERDERSKSPQAKRDREELKTKDQIEMLKTKKKVLVEDLYLLQMQEKRKYESMSKLEQQNFQVDFIKFFLAHVN